MSDFATRYVTFPDPLAAFDEATVAVSGLLSAANGRPGPLDWVRSHVVELCDEYAVLAEGSTEPAPDRGANHAVAFQAAAQRARAAFARPGYLYTPAETPIGLMPGSVTVQHVVNELVSHAWDLAHEIGAEMRVPETTIDRCRASWQVFFDTYGRPPYNFEPEKPVPADAPAADRLAAYLGRTV